MGNEIASFELANANILELRFGMLLIPTSVVELSYLFNRWGKLSFNDSINELHEYIAFNLMLI